MEPATKQDLQELRKDFAGLLDERNRELVKEFEGLFSRFQSETRLAFMDMKADLRTEFVGKKDFEQHLVAGHQ